MPLAAEPRSWADTRQGPLCPAGCLTNHGGPRATTYLGEDWLAIPPDDRPSWPAFLARHGRPDLADVPAPQPVTQEV